jgi:hypothetical protein
MECYVGLDVHSTASVFVIRDAGGQVVTRGDVPLEATPLAPAVPSSYPEGRRTPKTRAGATSRRSAVTSLPPAIRVRSHRWHGAVPTDGLAVTRQSTVVSCSRGCSARCGSTPST